MTDMNEILGKINVGSVIPPEYQGLAREWGLIVYSDLGILIAFLATSLFVTALFYLGLRISLGTLIERRFISDRILIFMSAVLGIFAAYSGAPIITIIMHLIVGYLGSLVAGAIILFILGGLAAASFYSARAAKREAEAISYEKGIELEEKRSEYFKNYYLLLSVGKDLRNLLEKILESNVKLSKEERNDIKWRILRLNYALNQKKLDLIFNAIIEIGGFLNNIKNDDRFYNFKSRITEAIDYIDSSIQSLTGQRVLRDQKGQTDQTEQKDQKGQTDQTEQKDQKGQNRSNRAKRSKRSNR